MAKKEKKIKIPKSVLDLRLSPKKFAKKHDIRLKGKGMTKREKKYNAKRLEKEYCKFLQGIHDQYDQFDLVLLQQSTHLHFDLSLLILSKQIHSILQNNEELILIDSIDLIMIKTRLLLVMLGEYSLIRDYHTNS